MNVGIIDIYTVLKSMRLNDITKGLSTDTKKEEVQ